MKRVWIVVFYLITIILVLFTDEIFFYAVPVVIKRIVLGAFFAFIIAEQNFANNSFFKFSRFKIISALGIYTYGLYCLHFVGIVLIEKGIDKFQINASTLLTSLLASFFALLVTVILSYTSYHLYEKWFLKLKSKFSFISKS